MISWHIDVVRTQSGELNFVCYLCGSDVQDANRFTLAFPLSELGSRLSDFRTYLIPHPVAQAGGVPMQQWGGKVAHYCREYSKAFFAHQDLVDCYQKIRQAGEALRIIIQTHDKYMQQVEVADNLLSTPLRFLCSPDAGPATDVTQWCQDLFLLKHPIERWIVRFPGEASSEISEGEGNESVSCAQPEQAGFNPGESKLLLISSWDSEVSKETHPVSEEVEQVSGYFGKYFESRLSTDESFVSTNGELLESKDWRLKSREKILKQKLEKADFIYLPNPPKPLIVATLRNLKLGTKLLVHYVGMVEFNGLRMIQLKKDPKDYTLTASVLNSLLRQRMVEVELLFVSCYLAAAPVHFRGFLNAMAQSENVLNLVSFRWPVWGRIAAEFAKTVYGSLEGATPEQAWTKLSYAMWQARQTIHAAYCANPAYAQDQYYCWAAPVLIRQAVGPPHPAQERGRALSEDEQENLQKQIDGAYGRLTTRLEEKFHKALDILAEAQRKARLADLDNWQRTMARSFKELGVEATSARWAPEAQQVRSKLDRVVNKLTQDLDNLG